LLAELVSVGTLCAFVVVCVGVLVLRYTRPDLERPFKVPAIWVVSLLGVLVCGGMALSLGWPNLIRLVGWALIGFVIYFMYGRKHSKLRASKAAA
jgi:APA family basic amino acid/polyamine antiporter